MARIKITRSNVALYEGKFLDKGDVIDPNPAAYGVFLVKQGFAEPVADAPKPVAKKAAEKREKAVAPKHETR